MAINGADGKHYRVDFAWPEQRVVLEADGRAKYRADELWHEKRREIALKRAGFRVVRVVWPAARAWLHELLRTHPSG
jgi:very-short-patch-repair endonuclease